MPHHWVVSEFFAPPTPRASVKAPACDVLRLNSLLRVRADGTMSPGEIWPLCQPQPGTISPSPICPKEFKSDSRRCCQKSSWWSGKELKFLRVNFFLRDHPQTRAEGVLSPGIWPLWPRAGPSTLVRIFEGKIFFEGPCSSMVDYLLTRADRALSPEERSVWPRAGPSTLVWTFEGKIFF